MTRYRMSASRRRVLQSLAVLAADRSAPFAQARTPILSRGGAIALHRGVYEVLLRGSPGTRNPYSEVEVFVVFELPDGSEVRAEGFYDGNDVFRARAYCRLTGQWRWRVVSNLPALSGQSGSFRVRPSSLKGKLQKHPKDSRQFAFDNGEWFLHIGDTGYRYVTDTEPKWKEYVDQTVRMGTTKVRTWFCRARHDVQVLFTNDRRELNLPYWQEMDRRLTYALETYPSLIFGLITYGEDAEEIRRYSHGNAVSPLIARYAQARFSAFPNVYWVVSNDMIIFRDRSEKPAKDPRETSAALDREISYDSIHRIATEMAAREPWGTLLTNHQSRGGGYSYVKEPWSNIIDLEDIDQVAARVILKYHQLGDDPIVLDEDRYECYRNPQHDRYFYRRLMWAAFSREAALPTVDFALMSHTMGNARAWQATSIPSKPAISKTERTTSSIYTNSFAAAG